MTEGDSISIWLDKVKQGDNEAARLLWQRYFPHLVRLAQRKLARVPRRMEDEEDVALSAFDSFCRAADNGRFAHVSNREDLWRLLCSITHHKAVDLIRRSRTAMGDANVLNQSGLRNLSESTDVPLAAPGAELASDFAAMVADEVRRLLNMLPDEPMRAIAVARMEGHTNQEIAVRLGCAERTVERRLQFIRVIWREEYQRGK